MIIWIIFWSIVSFAMGFAMFLYLGACEHKWKLIKNHDIVNREDSLVGFIKVYECEHCKKMKKEQISLYTK